jgi:hypothetical protein
MSGSGPVESDLTERMKQMSVYDLYKMTKKQDTVLIDAFIKKQLMDQPQNRPGVAPQVKMNNAVERKTMGYESLQNSYEILAKRLQKTPRRNSVDLRKSPRTPPKLTKVSSTDKRKYLTSINKRYVKNSPVKSNVSQSSINSGRSPQH